MSTAVRLELTLPGATPAAWSAAHLERATPADARPVDDLAAVVRAGTGRLADGHRRLVEDGTPPQAAALYLAGWFGGELAHAVGRVLALAGAGVAVDPDEVRWTVHPDGWPEHVALGRPAAVRVLADHPWAGLPEVTVVATAAEVLDPTVAALVAAAEPIVEGCRALAAVGRPGLWNEVGDGLGTALAHEDGVTVTPAMVAVLAAAVRAPAARWTARPDLRFASSALGPLHVVQKGGCCLAYTRPEWPEVPSEELGPAERAYRDAFPERPGDPHYCSTCSFRDPADADARQVRWRELVRAHAAAT